MEPAAAPPPAEVSPDEIARAAIKLYDSLPPKGKAQAREWTVLAAIVATQDLTQSPCARREPCVLALGVGSKCLPASKITGGGTQVFDSHAEVLCRRAFQLFLLKEIERAGAGKRGGDARADLTVDVAARGSEWLERTEGGKWRLRPHIRLHLYVSHTPSIFDEAEPTRKRNTALTAAPAPHSHAHTPPAPAAAVALASGDTIDTTALAPTEHAAKRSRLEAEEGAGAVALPRGDASAAKGVLRTKPGRGEPTHCLSCSDKIARWTVLGLQGALMCRLVEPVYLAAVVVGEMCNEEALRRALVERTEGLQALPPPFVRTPPAIRPTSVVWERGQQAVNAGGEAVSSGAALNWALACGVEATLAISGRLFGVTKKHASGPKSYSRLCKAAKFRAFTSALATLSPPPAAAPALSYRTAKRAAQDYYQAQAALHALAAFREWPQRPEQWEDFAL